MTTIAQQHFPLPNPTLYGRSVVLIEDHPESREFLTAVLQSLRAHVVTANGVVEGERRVALHRPHLIVCDMNLSDGTGLDFIKWLRAQPKQKQIPCIAITGYEQVFPARVARGFDAYMRKPINVDRFCTVAVGLARS